MLYLKDRKIETFIENGRMGLKIFYSAEDLEKLTEGLYLQDIFYQDDLIELSEDVFYDYMSNYQGFFEDLCQEELKSSLEELSVELPTKRQFRYGILFQLSKPI